MPKENEKIKYLPREKSLKDLFIASVDFECILQKIEYCQNTPKKSSKEKKLSMNLQDTHGI